MFKRGSLVWGKLNSYPWWPAIVISPEDCGRDKDEDDSKVWLFWFGDNKISQVKTENIIDFEMHFKDKSSKCKGKQMKKAISDILFVCGKRHNAITSYTHSSDLLAWASSGFKGSTVLTEKENDELPDMVLKYLEEKNFQRRNTETSESDTDSESDVINEVVLKVLKGVQKLEEICIICCKSRTVISKEHPYFIGGICKNCEVNMKNLSKFVFGKLQDICVICAQGGKLVYCCNNLCSSSYCDLCIDYLVGSKYFKQIMNNENWKCYLCEPVSNKECLIKRRFKFESKEMCAQSFPEEKKSVRVIAQSDAARKLLEKNIEVELYCYEPLNVQSSLKYQDFTKEQFSEIKADLVYGSYIVSTIVPIDAKKEMLAFSTEFFKFLFRLDNAKFFKPLVFFILVSDVELNVQMHKRVIRFLEVEPVTYKIGHRNIYVWTNIPDLSQEESKILELEIVENHTAEEEIISKYGETLKYFFKNA